MLAVHSPASLSAVVCVATAFQSGATAMQLLAVTSSPEERQVRIISEMRILCMAAKWGANVLF
jgi:hypothetical protein